MGCVVAHAFAQYAFATGIAASPPSGPGPSWPGWPTGCLARDVDGRGVEIMRAMGVAERTEPFDNDAFTNIAAAAVLRTPSRSADQVHACVPEAWGAMADRIVLPVRDGMILDHDGFRFDEEKAATPSAPAALLLFGHSVDPAIASTTRRAYLDVADDYVGSPMLSALLGVFAAHEGDRRRSSALSSRRATRRSARTASPTSTSTGRTASRTNRSPARSTPTSPGSLSPACTG